MSAKQRASSEQLSARLLETAPALFSTFGAVSQAVLCSRAGVILFANGAAATLLGAASPSELISRAFSELVQGDNLARIEARLLSAQTSSSLPRQRYLVTGLDGRPVELDALVFPLPFQLDGQPVLVSLLNSLEGLIPSGRARRQFIALFEGSGDAVLVLEASRRVISANPEAARLLGWPAEALEGRLFDELLTEAAPIAALLEPRPGDRPRPRPVSAEALHRGGRRVPVEVSLASLDLDGLRLFAATLRDRSATLESEEALRLSAQRYRVVFENASDGIFLADAAGRYVDVNPAGCAMLGYAREELLGLQMSDLVAEEDLRRSPLQSGAIVPGRRLVTERSLKRKDGSLVQVEIAGSRLPGGLLEGVVRDLSERQRQEEALRQAAKLDAVGRLAGGIAHDFNNILTVVLSLANALSAHVDPAGQSLLGELEQTGARAAELTKQLLAFARRQPANPRVIDLNEQVRVFSRFLVRTLGEDVRLELALCEHELWARLDPVHFEQILLNLAVNARDAMPAGGALTIASYPGEKQVFVVVTDTGSGMSEETLQHLFEPFFTTKDRGRGTGLGLATVYGIVKQSQGELAVSSEPGRGARFVLTFPAAEPSPEDAPRPATPVPARQGLSILVVEDDPAVRATLQRSLKAEGHSVYAVAALEPALQIVESGAVVDLLITDVVLPGAGGREIALAVRARLPSVPVLFVSGYAPDVERFAELGDLLPKPFTQASLRSAVALALRRRP